MLDWQEIVDAESGARCWRRYSTRRVRAHVQPCAAGFEWCASRVGELPLRWYVAESLELAKRAAEDLCDEIPDIGPIPL